MIQWEDTYPEEEKDIIEEVPMLWYRLQYAYKACYGAQTCDYVYTIAIKPNTPSSSIPSVICCLRQTIPVDIWWGRVTQTCCSLTMESVSSQYWNPFHIKFVLWSQWIKAVLSIS
jgi:hypothetical protein